MDGCRLSRFSMSTMTVILIILFECLVRATNAGKLPLNKFLRHYEALHYDASGLEAIHQRVRRSTTSQDTSASEVHLNFFAHEREFRIRLVQDRDTLSPQSVLSVDGETHPSEYSHIYQGHLEGEPSSYVHGSIIRGIFAGRIDTNGMTYYVDKSHLHFKEEMPFHSFIYSSDDVLHPTPGSDGHHHGSSCGLQNSGIHEWMKTIQNSVVEKPVEKPQHKSLNTENSYKRYTYGANYRREKRQTTGGSTNRMCSLLLQSDPMLWDYMKNITSKLGYTDPQIKDEITALFASHVNAIKIIYSNTSFVYQSFGPFNGITFAVHRMQINTSDICKTANANSNPFCKPNIDVSNFLNYNSLANQDLYCLAHVFTYRDFAQGTLGLAWVGSNSRTAGGICDKYKQYVENGVEVYKSLNTGIVTLSNYGSRVPTKVSQLTFAHEVGHGFGSPHDSGYECVPLLANPSDPRGNYIMYASATSGDKPNNQLFSKCSIGNMTLVINAVLNEQSGKVNCFEQSSQSFCGNRIVEGNEECDCGFDDDCSDPNHPDNCCYPQSSDGSTSMQCRRKPNASCSPSEGKCCASTCSFVPGSGNQTCQEETDCTMKSVCNGSSPQCPTAVPKVDLSICNDNTQICRKGECTGSVCEKIGWTFCYSTASTNDKNYDPSLLCYVSCLNPATNSCLTTGSQQELQKPENKPLQDLLNSLSLQNIGIKLPPGAPCDNYRGYCDVFRKCRSINEDGPLARLTNLLFSQQALTTVRDWITVHWWAVLLMGVGFVVGMGLFIKLCAVHTPSSNPNQKPARKMSDMTLTRRNHSRQQGNSVDRQPINAVSQGPQAGKRRKKQTAAGSSSKRHSTQSSQANNEVLEMRPPPHYDNRSASDFDLI